MSETLIVRNTIKQVKKVYGDDVKIRKTNDRFEKGVLDLAICFYGLYVVIEVKDPLRKRESVSWPMQRHTIVKTSRAHGFACAVESVDEALKFLEKIKEENAYLINLLRLRSDEGLKIFKTSNNFVKPNPEKSDLLVHVTMGGGHDGKPIRSFITKLKNTACKINK